MKFWFPIFGYSFLVSKMLYLCRRVLKSYGCKASVIEAVGFKTSLTDVENARLVFERTWNRCSPEIQEEFTSEYTKCERASTLLCFRPSTSKVIKGMAEPDVRPPGTASPSGKSI